VVKNYIEAPRRGVIFIWMLAIKYINNMGEIGMKEWIYMRNGKIEGTLSNKEMKKLYEDGIIKESTLVWKEGMYNWEELRQTKLFVYIVERKSKKNNFSKWIDKIKKILKIDKKTKRR
jgi:hypothetical protein